MGIAGAILGCLLLGQASDALPQSRFGRADEAPALLEPAAPATAMAPAGVAAPADASAPANATMSANPTMPASATAAVAAPSKPAANRRRPPELVAEAAVLPKGSTLSGQPLTLLNALTATQDRRQQLELTRAYWRLVQCVGDYHYCVEHAQGLERVKPSGNASASLRLAQASATAMLRQAELDATGAQYDLARLAKLPATAPLPLPTDRPHVGAYRTNFKELFAGKTPPESAVLMDRVLPIRRQTIDDQASAVLAAEDVFLAAGGSLDGAGDAMRNGMGQPQGDLVQSGQELLKQQRAFIRIVCEYNRNIAEYGLTVASPTATPQMLVAMLIGTAPPSNAPSLLSNGQPAGRIEPVANVARQPARTGVGSTPASDGWQRSQPTLAPPRDGTRKNEPAATPSRESRRSAANETPSLSPLDEGVRATSHEEPTLAPPRKGGKLLREGESTVAPRRVIEQPASPPVQEEPKNLEDQPLVPVQRTSAVEDLEPRTTQKPVAGSETAAAATTSALYPALVKAAPAVRTRQLTVALHWDRALPEGMGYAMTLADCLTRDPGTDRRATIAAYWLVRQRAAEYQVHAQQVEWLEALTPVVLEQRSKATGPADMLRLRSAQLTAKASLHEAHAALVEAQYALAVRVGATNDQAWPIATTIPHSGRYQLRLDSQPKVLVDSWPVRRLAATIPALGESVQQHAEAVVEADVARVAAVEKYRTGGGTVDAVIDSALAQTRETAAILSTLTEYNRALADYVLTVVPPSTPASRLVSSLVVKP